MKKIVILTSNEKTICKQQDAECDGINCRKCQFNKQGLEINRLNIELHRLYLYLLNKFNNLPNDVKATSLASETVDYLLDQEKYQKVLGEVYYKDREIE